MHDVELHISLFTMALWAIAILIALFGLDDFLYDMAAHGRSLWRRFRTYRYYRRWTGEDLENVDEVPIAVFVPAWNEAKVIGDMLKRFTRTIDYQNYRLFVGLYPNGYHTAKAAKAAVGGHPNVSFITLDHNGPTTKGDCLNHIWETISARTGNGALPYRAVVLHDAEDKIHALELRLFSHLFQKPNGPHMVQLPVIPEPPPKWYDLISGHYLDEFAQSHQKDLVIREALVGGVPSAGVACAFCTKALKEIADQNGGRPLSDESLTEDYALSMEFLCQGYKSVFVRLPDRLATDWQRSRHVIATRECFPSGLTQAVKQKARWNVGIALQAWRDFGWTGRPILDYLLYRDRRAPFANIVTAFAYALALITAFNWGRLSTSYGSLSQFGEEHKALAALLFFNLLFLANRLAHRVFYSSRLYGKTQGALSLLRTVVGNLVNFLAAIVAIYLFARHLMTGQRIKWSKTDHVFYQNRSEQAS